MLRCYSRFLFALIVVVPTIAGAAFYERNEGRLLVLTDDVSYRVDTPESSFESVFADKLGWVTQKEKPFSRTKDPIRMWAQFDLPAVAAVQRIFVDTSPWERAEYFVVRDGKLVDHQLQGTLVPLSDRSAHVGMTPSLGHAGFFAADLLPRSHTAVFARLSTNQDYLPIVRLRFYIWDAAQVLQGERRDRTIEGIYVGVMLVLILYNLGLFFMIREPSYFYYVILELGGVAAWSTMYGMTTEWLWPEHPSWDYLSLWLGLYVSTWGLLQFVRHYLDTHELFPRSDSVLKWMSYLALSQLLVMITSFGNKLVSSVGLYVFTIVGSTAVVSAFAVIVLALRRRHPLAMHFFTAALMGFFGFFVTVGESFNLLPATDWTIHAAQFGSAVTGIMLSMGLGFRLRHVRKELAKKQIEDALLQNRHEREKRELAEEHNRGLEAKVAERTAELVASQRQSDLLLANILPRAIIDELKERGTSEPRRHEDISILFTDFSGFTQAVATIPAKRLVQELDEIFRGFDDIVTANGLEKIKTIGDAYMVASGLPVASADHATRCVRAGLAMTQFIEERNQTAAMKWGLRVGVHSGAVVAGIVGKNKYAYDVWGDTVNIASRRESAGEVNKVNVSAYTYELVRDRFDCEYRGKLAAKGKGEIDMYFVVREKAKSDAKSALPPP